MTGGARIAVVGEALVDIVERPGAIVDESPGGSPANAALALGRLDRHPTLFTRLGDDDRGCRIRAWLEDSGVRVRAAAAPRTSTATARLAADGGAEYRFDLEWDLGDDLDALRSEVGRADLVHVGSVAAVLEPGAQQVADLVRSVAGTATVTYDPNIRPSLVDDADRVRSRVRELIALADVVKASDEDVRWLHPGRDVADVARDWVRAGPAIVVVTRGAAGALGVTAAGEVHVPAVRSAVVDTVGAGDTFMGTLIDGLVASGTPARAGTAPGRGIRLGELDALLRRCAAAAAITVSRPGADPPRRAELAAAL